MILLFLALYASLFCGWLIGKHVPDEIEPSRAYLRLVPGFLLFLMLVLAIAPRSPWLAMASLAVLPLLRFPSSYLLLSGLALGGAIVIGSPHLLLITLLALLGNYLVGALNTHRILVAGLPQALILLAANWR